MKNAAPDRSSSPRTAMLALDMFSSNEGVIGMDHAEVVRRQMTERYLLDELDSAERDEFEGHFFDCPECAADVHAGTVFIDQSKIVLAEKATAEQPEPILTPAQPGWFSWFRPVFALPATALLLLVVAYQNMVTIPYMSHRLNTPQVLPFAAVNVGTYGSDAPAVVTHPGESFLVFVRIPPDSAFVRYTAELYDPERNLEWNLAFVPQNGQDEYPVQVPGKNWKAGRYALTVSGMTAAGERKEIGNAQFEVQVQK
jgi:hypothetical protein